MHVDVTSRGAVDPALAREAAREVSALEDVVKGPLTHARVVLIEERNPRIERAARAEAEVLLAGRPVRARAGAESMDAAVDAVAERLHDQLRRHVERMITRQRVPAGVHEGEWRHGAWSPPRPPRSWRPFEERRVVRRKSFALEPMTAEAAALEMSALDHDFFLFRDADTGADALLYSRDDGRLAVIGPVGVDAPSAPGPLREPSRYSDPLPLAAAVSEMDELDRRFLYFTDAGTGRGCVLYLRYDGHYGLIEPAS